MVIWAIQYVTKEAENTLLNIDFKRCTYHCDYHCVYFVPNFLADKCRYVHVRTTRNFLLRLRYTCKRGISVKYYRPDLIDRKMLCNCLLKYYFTSGGEYEYLRSTCSTVYIWLKPTTSSRRSCRPAV